MMLSEWKFCELYLDFAGKPGLSRCKGKEGKVVTAFLKI